MRNVRIKATSQDGLFKYLTYLTVKIKDINDNRPIFDEYLFSNSSTFNQFTLVENTTNGNEPQLIGYYRATDLDSGPNGRVNFKIDPSLPNYKELDVIFDLEKETGKLWLRQYMGKHLDREINETINMNIIAYDLGKPESLFSILEVNLKVLDVNDNFPTFKNLEDKSEIEFFIEENTVAFNYTLTSFDLDFGDNATIYYYLRARKESEADIIIKKFRIEPLTGEIFLNSPLDYEERKAYEFDVICSDSGEPTKLSSAMKFKINVIDVNDNVPEFSSNVVYEKEQYRLHIDESLVKKGFFIKKFDAIDLDPTEKFHNTSYKIKNIFKIDNQFDRNYVVVSENVSKSFAIGKKTGELRYESELKLDDSSLTNEYLVEIEAIDEDKPHEFRRSINFTIILLPSRNKLPIFTHKIAARDLNKDEAIEARENKTQLSKDIDKYLTLFRRSLDESKTLDHVVDVLKAIDPNNHGIKYYLDEIEPVNSVNEKSDENSISLSARKFKKNQGNFFNS